MEAELVTLRQQPASPARDGRIAHLEAAVQTLKSLAEIRREIRNGIKQLRIARLRRETLAWRDKPTTKVDEKIARLLKEQEARKAKRTTLVARALSLGLKESRRRRAPQGIDTDRYHAFELELADPDLDADRLAGLEHDFGELVGDDPDALDADFFEEIWREAGDDAAHELDGGDLDGLDPDFLEGLLRDIGDGDADGELDGLDPEFIEGLLRDIEEEGAAPHEPGHGTADGVDVTPPAQAPSPPRRPSPEPAAPADTGFQALLDELRAQRSAFETEIQDLIRQHAEQSQALAGPGSSRHAEGVRRLRAIEAELQELQQRWRQQMQNRLDLARQRLWTRQTDGRPRDATIEADLARQIVLLEYEVQNPSF